MNYQTIGEWEESIRKTLDKLPFSRDLAPELEPLLSLVPTHVSPKVEFRYHSGRKIREDAAAAYFQPETCEVLIRFEVREQDAPTLDDAPQLTGSPSALDPEMEDLLKVLLQAESTLPFVALKWFRDQCLPERGPAWTHHPAARHNLLRRAIEESLVLTGQVSNPNNPEHPTTTVSVNRHHPKVRGVAMQQTSRARFQPVEIRGEPLSKTVLDERR